MDSFDSMSWCRSAQHWAKLSSWPSSSEVISSIHPFPLSRCGCLMWFTQSPSTLDSINNEPFHFSWWGMSVRVHAIFHFTHVMHTRLPGTHSHCSFHWSQLIQGGWSLTNVSITAADNMEKTHMIVGAQQPHLHPWHILLQSDTSRSPVSQGCPSEFSSNLLTTFCSNYRVGIGAVGIKNLEDLANRNSSVTVRTLIYW